MLLLLLWVCGWASENYFLLHAESMFMYETFKVELQSTLVTVQEGLCVFVPCTFFSLFKNPSFNTTVFGYWFRAGSNTDLDFPVATNNPDKTMQETHSQFHLFGDPRINDCSLDIRDAQRSDSGYYFFRTESDTFKWNYYKDQLFLNVTGKVLVPC